MAHQSCQNRRTSRVREGHSRADQSYARPSRDLPSCTRLGSAASAFRRGVAVSPVPKQVQAAGARPASVQSKNTHRTKIAELEHPSTVNENVLRLDISAEWVAVSMHSGRNMPMEATVRPPHTKHVNQATRTFETSHLCITLLVCRY